MAAQRRFPAAVHAPGACQGRAKVCGYAWRALGVLHGCDSSREARARASPRALVMCLCSAIVQYWCEYIVLSHLRVPHGPGQGQW